MSLNTALASASAAARYVPTAEAMAITQLDYRNTGEVLAFLNERPECTFMMSGFILDNGLNSPLNRGTFYGCRDSAGRLDGVALIGEITLLEGRNDGALATFARAAQTTPGLYMIIGEPRQVHTFWNYYAETEQPMRRFCRELLFELRGPLEVAKPAPGLRLATLSDLESVIAVHAEMAMEESDIDPLVADPEGFRERCARRVKQRRTWVCTEGRRLVFKADVISETPEIVYLEGVYVNPQDRSQGKGARYLSALSQHLLGTSKSICLLVNERNHAAQALYRKCRYQFRRYYDTIFF
jgi:ribosomal protein S18 acetylase RimI-like enzyme